MEVWSTNTIFWTWTGQSITALIAWRKEEWRKEAAEIPLSKVESRLCSTRHNISTGSWDNLGKTAERRGGARMGLSERYDAIWSWKWKWNWVQRQLLSLTTYNLRASARVRWALLRWFSTLLAKRKMKTDWFVDSLFTNCSFVWLVGWLAVGWFVGW